MLDERIGLSAAIEVFGVVRIASIRVLEGVKVEQGWSTS
jgi:hypothetical protein